MNKKTNGQVLLGAAFLMATSAIGPGFLTQTTVFTQQLLASFAFVIVVSIILDIVAQLNTWRIISVSGKRAPVLANEMLRGSGHLLTILIIFGGLAFNIGNMSGTGLGFNVLFGLSVEKGALISCIVAIFVFVLKEANLVMDWFVKILGIFMLGLTLYIAIHTHPPVKETLVNAVWPENISFTAIVTLVGGTVGGYIIFAGAHRLLDSGIQGETYLQQVTKSSVSAIGIASLMRILLFMASLGVVMQTFTLDPANPAASVYRNAAGYPGYKIFGIVMWAASITSVVGSSYTSVSFLQTLHPSLPKYKSWLTILFILVSTFVFVLWGKPVKILILAGAINGFILPFSLGLMLLAARKKDLMGNYRHPVWLSVSGWLVVALMIYLSIKTFSEEITKF